MATNTTNLGLRKPATSDPVDVTADISDNMDIIDAAVVAHTGDATGVHGIADTAVLETTTGSAAKVTAHEGAANPHPNYATDTDLSTHAADTTAIHGIGDTAQLATNASVTAAINAVIDAAPGALDTLNELAAALGDDPNFSTTITNSIAGKIGNSIVDAKGDLIVGTDADTVVRKAAGANGTFLKANSGTGDGLEWVGLVDGDIPAAIARDSEVTTAISTHEAAGDPHPGYATDADLTTHVGAADPHPGYLTQTEGDTRYRQTATALVDGDIPAGIARDTEVTAAVSAHESDTTGVHGIADTSILATATDVSTAVSNHSSDTTGVHGIADTADLVTGTNIATGTPDGTKFLRDDRSWQEVPTGPEITGVPIAAPADGTLAAAQVSLWIDETGNTLTFKVKYTDGTTVKSGTVALT